MIAEKTESMNCPYCGSPNHSDSYLPSTHYNGKKFDYLSCSSCQLIYIHPLPNNEDLLKMYPPSYQDGVDHTILKTPYKKLSGLRYSYGEQFDLIKQIGFKGKMIDFGCGTANFLINANHEGIKCDGVEFNPKHVEILKQEVKTSQFYTVDEFLNGDEKYDMIRLSNVLEHFTSPKEMMEQLKTKLTPNGFFFLEGPIETNFNLALQFRKVYFTLRKKVDQSYIANHKPTHITFANKKNQLAFFNSLGLETVEFKIREAEWPFPNSMKNANGMVQKLNFIIARISMFFGQLIPAWGNTFIYVGKV